MKPKDALEQIESTLEVMKTRDLTNMHKLAAMLFRPADALAVIDQPLSDEIKAKLTEILSSAELAPILLKIEEIKELLVVLKAKLVAPALSKRYLGVYDREYLPAYIKSREKYGALSNQLDELENKILEAPEYNKKLHEIWGSGKWAGHRHARLTGNIRVMYSVTREKNVVLFEEILTKNELEKT